MNTRVPFDDDYVKLVGTAVYLFSYYEWAIIYVVERLEPGFVPEYCRKHRRGMTSGTVFTRFMNAVERYAGDKGVEKTELKSQSPACPLPDPAGSSCVRNKLLVQAHLA